jgi:hypothetical protein
MHETLFDERHAWNIVWYKTCMKHCLFPMIPNDIPNMFPMFPMCSPKTLGACTSSPQLIDRSNNRYPILSHLEIYQNQLFNWFWGNTSTCVCLGRIGESNILWLLCSMFCRKGFDFSRMLDHFSKCIWAIEINNEFTFVEATYAILTWDATFHWAWLIFGHKSCWIFQLWMKVRYMFLWKSNLVDLAHREWYMYF